MNQIDNLLKIYNEKLNDDRTRYKNEIEESLDKNEYESMRLTKEQKEKEGRLGAAIFRTKRQIDDLADNINTKNLGDDESLIFIFKIKKNLI